MRFQTPGVCRPALRQLIAANMLSLFVSGNAGQLVRCLFRIYALHTLHHPGRLTCNHTGCATQSWQLDTHAASPQLPMQLTVGQRGDRATITSTVPGAPPPTLLRPPCSACARPRLTLRMTPFAVQRCSRMFSRSGCHLNGQVARAKQGTAYLYVKLGGGRLRSTVCNRTALQCAGPIRMHGLLSGSRCAEAGPQAGGARSSAPGAPRQNRVRGALPRNLDQVRWWPLSGRLLRLLPSHFLACRASRHHLLTKCALGPLQVRPGRQSRELRRLLGPSYRCCACSDRKCRPALGYPSIQHCAAALYILLLAIDISIGRLFWTHSMDVWACGPNQRGCVCACTGCLQVWGAVVSWRATGATPASPLLDLPRSPGTSSPSPSTVSRQDPPFPLSSSRSAGVVPVNLR